MDIKAKAKQYAEGKAQEAITSAVEQAYIKGYEAGYADGLNRNEVTNQGIVTIGGLEYVDLNLPSGTLWSKNYIDRPEGTSLYLKYYEAAKLNIPTQSQFDELDKYCTKEIMVFKGNVCGIRYKSRESNAYLDLHYCTGFKDKEPIKLGSFGFWLSSWGEHNMKHAMIATIKGTIFEEVDVKFPVRVVSKKRNS